MSTDPENPPSRLPAWTPVVGYVVVAAIAAAWLHHAGRIWWCKCGSYVPWSFEIWSMHNSQHFFDPYSFTHVLHGVMFFGLLFGAFKLGKLAGFAIPVEIRHVAAMAIEGVWEAVENSQWIIDKYRADTVSLDYSGDSVINSMSDILMCGIGFYIASKLPWQASVALFVVVEIVLLLTIHDSLIVNIILLIHPVQAIKDWQMSFAPP
jgi:hypothetical protein